jgi:hypothetical protein
MRLLISTPTHVVAGAQFVTDTSRLQRILKMRV